MPYSLTELNQATAAEFVAAIGGVYEETPAVARQAWRDRPFTDLTDLQTKLHRVVEQFTAEQQLTLIRAHPDLGSRAQMAAASVQEQTGAGLTSLSPTEYDRLLALNTAYKTKFGFPFIVAVRDHTKASVFTTLEQRLAHDLDTERQQTLAEIHRIAALRLQDWVTA